MSYNRGLICTVIFDKSVNKLKFGEFIHNLSSKMGNKPFTMFMDNLACHHSKESKVLYHQRKINYIYNASYTHEMNPIEMVFSKTKAHFKAAKCSAIVNKKPFT